MKKLRIHQLSFAIALAMGQVAFAEEAKEEESSAEMETVLVVGKSVARANNLVTEEMLHQQSNITNVMAAVDNLPGIMIQEGDTFGSDDWSASISMRGFVVDLNNQQLGMTMDGIPLGESNYGGGTKPNRWLDSENLMTVEVSQGTSDISSASRQSLGGTLAFLSDDPKTERGMEMGYTVADYDGRRYFARYDTGEFMDNTYAYFSYSDTHNARWIGTGSNGQTDRNHFEAKFVSTLGAIDLTARLSFDDAAEDNYNGVTIEQFAEDPDWDRLTSNWTGIPVVDQMFAEGWSTLRRNDMAYLGLEFEPMENATLNVKGYYHNQWGRGDWIPPYQLRALNEFGVAVNEDPVAGQPFGYAFYTDSNGAPLSPVYCGDVFDAACYASGAVPAMSYRHTHYSLDRKGLLVDFDWTIGMNDIKAGLWWEDKERYEHRDWHKVIDARTYWNFEAGAYYLQYQRTYNTSTTKLYLQDTIELGDFLITAGVKKFLVNLDRYDHFLNAETGSTDSDSDALFNLGAVWAINDQLEAYAGYTENFRAIDDNVLERTDSDLSQLTPETADNLDVGLRYTGDKLNLGVALYSVDFNNRITFLTPESDGLTDINYVIGTNGSYVNVGGIESTGLEISAGYQLTDNISLYSSFTNNSSEYKGNVSGITAGNKVAGAPETMAVLSMDYNDGKYRAGFSAKYTGERYGNLNNTDVLEANTVVDTYIGMHQDVNNDFFKAVDINLSVNNFFDERYLGTVYSPGATGSYFIGGPRTTALNVTLEF